MNSNSGSNSIENKTKNNDVGSEVKTKKNHVSFIVIFLCFLIAFGGFVFGFDTGTISGFVNMENFIESFGGLDQGAEKKMSVIRTGIIVSVFNIGCAFGGIFLSKAADLWGRRFGIIFSMIVYILGIIVQITSFKSWVQFTIGRLITGLAVGVVTVLCPLFISESAPKDLRGNFVFCFQLCITLGIFIGYCCTFGTKNLEGTALWKLPLGLCFVWSLILIISMLLLPESPRYLIGKNKVDDAKKSVSRMNSLSIDSYEVSNEIHKIQIGIEKESEAGNASWKELATGKPAILQRVIMGMTLQSLQQLTGDNYFFYYGTTIFQTVGFDDSYITSMILGAVNFLSTFIGIWAIERLGRRVTLLSGSFCMFVCFVIYSIIGSKYLYLDDSYDNNNTNEVSGKIMIAITCIYIFFFATTWAGGVFTIISESYPLRIRSKAMGIASAANWIWGFLISLCTPLITSKIHFNYGFVFTACLLFSFFYVYFFVKETKGLSLEEVDEIYAQNVKPWKSSKWKVSNSEDHAISTSFESSSSKSNIGQI